MLWENPLLTTLLCLHYFTSHVVCEISSSNFNSNNKSRHSGNSSRPNGSAGVYPATPKCDNRTNSTSVWCQQQSRQNYYDSYKYEVPVPGQSQYKYYYRNYGGGGGGHQNSYFPQRHFNQIQNQPVYYYVNPYKEDPLSLPRIDQATSEQSSTSYHPEANMNSNHETNDHQIQMVKVHESHGHNDQQEKGHQEQMSGWGWGKGHESHGHENHNEQHEKGHQEQMSGWGWGKGHKSKSHETHHHKIVKKKKKKKKKGGLGKLLDKFKLKQKPEKLIWKEVAECDGFENFIKDLEIISLGLGWLGLAKATKAFLIHILNQSYIFFSLFVVGLPERLTTFVDLIVPMTTPEQLRIILAIIGLLDYLVNVKVSYPAGNLIVLVDTFAEILTFASLALATITVFDDLIEEKVEAIFGIDLREVFEGYGCNNPFSKEKEIEKLFRKFNKLWE